MIIESKEIILLLLLIFAKLKLVKIKNFNNNLRRWTFKLRQNISFYTHMP